MCTCTCAVASHTTEKMTAYKEKLDAEYEKIKKEAKDITDVTKRLQEVASMWKLMNKFSTTIELVCIIININKMDFD